MRITGGEVKGREFHFPSRSTQRPTTDFLRETLFNLLGFPVEKNFLDLFAGSGSVGLEALSRAAKKATFVEKRKEFVTIIRKNVALCGYENKSEVIHADFKSALRELYSKERRFDVIFADPPYNQGFMEETIRALVKYPVLQDAGIIVLQHSIRETLKVQTEGWIMEDQRKYGDNLLTFIRTESTDAREI